jgi:uncharacterized heparinase superfamily protein
MGSFIVASIARQLKHLERVIDKETSSYKRLVALKGILYAGFALPQGFVQRDDTLSYYAMEVENQIWMDGFHQSRNPSIQMNLLRDLLEIRHLHLSGNLEIPLWLQVAIESSAKALRVLRHGDHGLAVFHGGYEENGDFADVLLQAANQNKGRPLDQLDHAGWYRLVSQRSLLIFDGGDYGTHKSPFAFEFSVGRERLIANCGTGQHLGPDWARAMVHTAAHSCLCLKDEDIIYEGAAFKVERHQSEGNVWLEAQHDGYAKYGVLHQRRLFLNNTGDDLRGEDILLRQNGAAAPLPFNIRFHLHPKVQAIETQSGILLRLPSGIGFRLRASGGKMHLEKSVYSGIKGDIQKTAQIVVSGELIETEAQIKWAIQRESKK